MAAEPDAPSAQPTRRHRKVAVAAAPEFDLAASIGGVRGVIESVLPYTIFSLVYGITKDLQTSIIVSMVPVVVLVIWRLIARETLSQAISGALVIVLGAYLAQRTGNAVNFFLPNILKNAGFALAYAASIVARWPVIGIVVGPVTGEMFAWRHDPPRLAAYQRATWLWVGLFAVRLAVQLPLYLTEQVTLLGTLNGLVLGIPLFALTIWLSWLVLKPVPPTRPAAEAPSTDHQPSPGEPVFPAADHVVPPAERDDDPSGTRTP